MIIETFLQDIRFGLRTLIREKSFCAVAVFVLALGICTVATQFAIINGVLLRAFPFRDANRLVDVRMADPANFSPARFNSLMTTADFVDLRDQQKSFSEFVGYISGATINLTWNGLPSRLQGAYITHDFFRALGVAPVLGRDFLPEEDREGADKAVILSDALWRSEFGADPVIIGKTVRVNGRSGTIVGVMPPKFSFPASEQLWIPLNTEYPVKPRSDRSRILNVLNIVARLKPGVSMEQASADVSGIAKGFATAYPDTNRQFTLGYVRPLIKAFAGGGTAIMLYTMLVFCVGVLLIACVNVMNMQFARAILRTKELAVRSSLGATRWRLIRQMLTESLLVASFGAMLGVTLAYWCTDFLNTMFRNIPNLLPSWMSFSVDTTVLVFVIAATMISALVSGLVPAWLSSRTSAVEALKESGRGNTSRAVSVITKGLVVFQVLVTCLLLIGGLLEVQSIVRQQRVDYGYDTAGIIGARVALFGGDYPINESRQLFYNKLLRELRASPEFEAVALTNRIQMVFSGSGPVEIEGRQYAKDADRTVAQFENVTPGYQDVLGQKITEGRYFTDEDSDQRQPVAVVNATFAKKHFGTETAIGRRFRTTAVNGSSPGPWRAIVGVVSDVRMLPPISSQGDNAGFYVPYFASAVGPVAAAAVAPQFGTIVAKPRGGGRGEAAAQGVRNAIKRVDPDLPAYFVSTPKVSIGNFLGANRIVAVMFAVFGAIAVVLASVGLYGVTSFSANQRTQEFGIRMALGADANRILGMVLKQGSWPIIIGPALGIGLTFLLAILGRQGIQNFLFETSPTDPLTYLAVGLLVAFVSLVATLIPARRATKVDPMTALRAE